MCVDKALSSDGKNTVQAKQWLDKGYLDSTPVETKVKRLYADFRRGHIDTNDAEHSGRPISAVVQENTKKLHKFVLADRKLKLYEIAEELKISEGSVFTICMNICQWESCVQSGCYVCSQSIKNNKASTI